MSISRLLPMLKRLLLALAAGVLCVCLLLGVLTGQSHAQTPEPTPPPPSLTAVAAPQPASVRVEKAIEPSGQLQPGQEGRIKILLTGDLLQACYGTPGKPIDAVVLIDTSPSAGAPVPGSNLARSQDILRSLWGQMDQPVYADVESPTPRVSRLALMTVDPGVTNVSINVRLPFTNTTSAIESAVSSLPNGADSGFADGINLAAKYLVEQGREDASPVLILLMHDSFFASQNTVQEAAREAASQVQVFVIGNTLNIQENEQLTSALVNVLTASENTSINPTAEDLRRLFVRATGSSENVAARSFRIYDEFIPAGLIDITGIEDGGRIEANRVVWDVPIVETSKSVELNYRFRVRPNVSGPIQTSTGAACLDCNGYLHTYLSSEGRPVNTPVATPELEIGAPEPEVTPDATPTSTPVLGPVPGPSPGTLAQPISESTPLPPWLLGLLLIPLLLILLWLLMRLLRRRSKSTPPAGVQRPTIPLQETVQVRQQQTPTGAEITPGSAPDDAALLQQLYAASAFTGHISTGLRGTGRSQASARVFKSSAELSAPGGLNLEAMGRMFTWQRQGQSDIEVPTSLLQKVLRERLSSRTPMAAMWTQQPADNATLEMRIGTTPDARQITVQPRSTYRTPAAGQKASLQAYWLNLQFINNFEQKSFLIFDAVELERN